MQEARLRRLQEVIDLFERELQNSRPSIKRASKRARAKGYGMVLINEALNHLIVAGKLPVDTPSVWQLAA